MKEMSKRTMINNYRKFSAADSYIIGFIYKHEVYEIEVPEIMPRFMVENYQSKQNGGHKILRLSLKKRYKEQLIRKGAVKLGSEDILKEQNTVNKGWAFEKIITERNGFEWEQDHIGFWVQGDIKVNGVEKQIKLDGAQIVVETTLKKLQKRG